MTVAGAVLCGGRSTRMGRDKATLEVDGEAMAAHVADALRAAGCDPIVAIGGDARAMAALGLEPVTDLYPGDGPLGGIITALGALAEPTTSAPQTWVHGEGVASVDAAVDAVVVVSCDLPWLTATTIQRVIAGLGEHDVAVAHGERREPLCAVWRPTCLGRLRAGFDDGRRAVHGAIDGLDAVDVPVDPPSVRNVNTPDDVREASRGHDG
ncbi:MAG: putative molybdenum cofactor biosynthesis protein [Ilumatobacteraceae bacterium]|nr:putative molybdenum cofactor biosynthesis protein [Ilumatobacteraceae bacterium]